MAHLLIADSDMPAAIAALHAAGINYGASSEVPTATVQHIVMDQASVEAIAQFRHAITNLGILMEGNSSHGDVSVQQLVVAAGQIAAVFGSSSYENQQLDYFCVAAGRAHDAITRGGRW